MTFTPPACRRLALACLIAAPWATHAASTADTPCQTTQECAAQARQIGATGGAAPTASGEEDQFAWMNRINQASIVMLVEEGIVTPDMGRKIAGGVAFTMRQGDAPGGKRPSDVMQVERIMTDEIGPEGSLIHAGRSRQDMYATYRNARLRAAVLDYTDAMNASRERVLALAEKNVDTLVPAYTNGVQAMPVSYAHYLLAYEASFARDAQRVRDLYARLNLSAMGTAVLANSAWPLNRERLAALLGFDGVVENSLDAGQVITFDVPLEATSIASSAAIRIGALMGDLHTQYHQIRPWILLEEGATYASSAMPQKRNPGLIMRVREAASDVVGLAHATTLRAHNVTTGMTDYKAAWDSLGVYPAARSMWEGMDKVLAALVVDPKRAREELDAEWTTSMELADTLQRRHNVPFRVGHGFASLVVSYAREHGLAPRDFPYAEAQRLYSEAAAKYRWSDTTLPLDEAAFQATLSAEDMVNTRVGTGGPQPTEVQRMLTQARQTLERDRTWLRERREKLAEAQRSLEEAFQQLVDKPAG